MYDQFDMDEDYTSFKYREIVCRLWELFMEHITHGTDNIETLSTLFYECKSMTIDLAVADNNTCVIPDFVNILEKLRRIESKLKTLRIDALFEILPHQVQQVSSCEGQWIASQLSLGDSSHLVDAHCVDATSSFYKTHTDQPNISTADKFGDQQTPKKKVLTIETTRQEVGPNDLSSVAGLSEAKQLFREAVILPLKHPQLFVGGRRPWNRILLFGPPGTGKTHLAHAVAAEAKSALYQVTSADLLSSWVGESEKGIRELFQHVNKLGERAVIFFDEIDGLCRKRTSNEHDHTRRIKTELLSQMEKLDTHVFLLAATNCPWDLDKAFLRRFQRRVYIPLPERDARLAIFQRHTQGNQVSLTKAQWDTVADHSEGYSGSDLVSIANSALMEPVRDLENTTHWIKGPDGYWRGVPKTYPGAEEESFQALPPLKVREREVELKDFLKAINETNKTISDEDLEEYNHFTNKYK